MAQQPKADADHEEILERRVTAAIGPEGTLEALAQALTTGEMTSRELVEGCLAQIADPHGEGERTFVSLNADIALAAADYHDRARAEGQAASRFAGIPISIKDNMDVAGEITTAGSQLLKAGPSAVTDAPLVTRLRAAGFIPLGRTAMTEFAFSGLGLNPHYGTPLNRYGREKKHIPGGSSAGAAVSVTDGMAAAAIGTDTGGSCRIPAAFCGLVGFKPSGHRIPMQGVYPLSTTLDRVGSLGKSTSCCSILDAVMAGESLTPLPRRNLAGLRGAAIANYVRDDMSRELSMVYDAALERLAAAGVRIEPVSLGQLEDIPVLNAKGGFPAPELYARLRATLATESHLFDPRVLRRIQRGMTQDAADYIDLHVLRQELIRRTDTQLGGFDFAIMPTTPIVAPQLDELADDDAFDRINLLALRNPTIANLLDRPAISLPCGFSGTGLPFAISLMGHRGADRDLLTIAAAVEHGLSVCGDNAPIPQRRHHADETTDTPEVA